MPKKILAVDDERHIVRLVQVNLERAGYTVVTAFNGKEALEQVEAEQPDLVVLARRNAGLERDPARRAGPVPATWTERHL